MLEQRQIFKMQFIFQGPSSISDVCACNIDVYIQVLPKFCWCCGLRNTSTYVETRVLL